MIGYQPEDGASNEELIAWDTLQALLSTGSPQLSYEPLPGSSNFEALLWDIYQNIGGGGGGGGISSITSLDGTVDITATGSSRDLSVVGFLPVEGSDQILNKAKYSTAASVYYLEFNDEDFRIDASENEFFTGSKIGPDGFIVQSFNSTTSEASSFLVNSQGVFFAPFEAFTGVTFKQTEGDFFRIGVFDKYVNASEQSLAIPNATDLASAISSLNLLLQSQRDYGWIAE